MKSHPDYPIINQVESFLISNQLPTKLLSDTKSLVQSKHVTDNFTFIFTSPSQQCLKKLQKICPINTKTAGKDCNANLRAFVVVTLESVFSSNDDFYENLLIEKFVNQIPNLMKKFILKNNNHQSISGQNMLKVISGFLKTLSNKKLKNCLNFNLQKQLQALPIILDYFIIAFRAILGHFGIQNANDNLKPVKDQDSYLILSEYFDINFIKKQNFYLFEENAFFIFKDQTQYIFGIYQLFGSRVNNQQKTLNEIKQKYQDNFNMQIMECSMESGSYMVSSRHADESTPHFNNLNGQQFLFRSNEIKNTITQQDQSNKQSKSKSFEQNKPQSKCFDSKNSQFQVNIYSEERDKFFNNKYKNPKSNKSPASSQNQNNNHANSEPAHKQRSFPKVQKKDSNTNFMSGKQAKINQDANNLKKVSSDKRIGPSNSVSEFKKQQYDDSRNQKHNSQNICRKEKQIVHQPHKHDFLNDKIFEWQDQQRRLRRVQTICYKTCSTCHRRFYKNQIQSNVLQIKINTTPKTQSIKDQQNQKVLNFATKNPPDFLNKKFNKKSNEFPDNFQTPRINDNVQKNIQKQKQFSHPPKAPQLNWLNKKIRTDIANGNEKGESGKSSPAGSPKNLDTNKPLQFRNEGESPKKVLSIKNLFVHNKEKQGNHSLQKNINKVVDLNENKRPSIQKKDLAPKLKSFFTLKSAKQLQKIKSIDKLDFFKDKISNDGTFKSNKNLQMTNNSTIKGNIISGQKDNKVEVRKRDNMVDKNQQIRRRQQQKNSVQDSKSVQKKMPRFIKKDSLNTALDLVMNG